MTTLTISAETGASALEIAEAFTGTPNADGIFATYELDLPEFETAVYYAAFQAYDMAGPHVDNWPEAANRVQPLAMTDLSELKRGGIFMLLELGNGRFAALLPVAGPRAAAWFESEAGKPVLRLGNLGTGAVSGDLPLLAWAVADNADEAATVAWAEALAHPLVGSSTRWRCEKHYPEAFRYLGWCSWEEYRKDIDEKNLVAAAEALKSSGLPIRYMLVDDGHLDDNERRLRSFETNEKFPNGWTSLMATRDANTLRWIGLWLNFNGYWAGIAPENALGDLNEHFQPRATGDGLVTKPGWKHSTAFYDAMIGRAREAGFDFVKIDNQANNLKLCMGTEQPVECAAHNAQALEAACARHMDGLINCMAHGPVCLFNTRVSAVTRCSEDYLLGDAGRAKRHLHNSYANMLWFGQTVWGDHDMFHSNDPASGLMMAVSKAMSGGPVYLSDAPSAFVPERIRPLCYRDGELLRPLAPAMPLPDCVFMNPFADSKAYRAIAPLSNGAAAVVAYNLTEPEVAVEATVSADDYTHAGAMIQPVAQSWEIPADGLLCYDWYAGTATPLTTPTTVELPTFEDRLFILSPIQDDWAVVGRSDLFLSPVAIDVLEIRPGRLLVRVLEGGPIRVWNGNGSISCEACELRNLGDGLWEADAMDCEPGDVLEFGSEA